MAEVLDPTDRIEGETIQDPVSHLRGSTGNRALAVIAMALLAATAGCDRRASEVKDSFRACLYSTVPAFHSRVCDPAEAPKLLDEASHNCPDKVGDLDESLAGPPWEVDTVRKAGTEVLNEECQSVKKDDKGIL